MSDETSIDEQDPVLYEVADHVATITLNRPHRRNAISVKMLDMLGDALAEADRSGDVRAIVLTGAGKGFCSGLDIKDAMSGTGIGGEGAAAGCGLPAHTHHVLLQTVQRAQPPSGRGEGTPPQAAERGQCRPGGACAESGDPPGVVERRVARQVHRVSHAGAGGSRGPGRR